MRNGNSQTNPENVFERSGGEVGGHALVPAPSLLERNIRRGRDYVSPRLHLRREGPERRRCDLETSGRQWLHGGAACSPENCGRHGIGFRVNSVCSHTQSLTRSLRSGFCFVPLKSHGREVRVVSRDEDGLFQGLKRRDVL